MLYLLQVSLIWAVFYGLYVGLLRQETFHTTNRFYLLGALIAGLVLPLLPALVWDNQAEETVTLVLAPISASRDALEQLSTSWYSTLGWLERWFWTLYGVGIGVNGYRFLSGAWQLWRLMHRTGWTSDPAGFRVVEVPGLTTPFSFFRVLFWGCPAHAGAEDRALMRAHELAHMKQWHSADVFFLELLSVFFWWNPLVYYYKQALRTLHEYLADAAALLHTDTQHYGRLLIGQAQSGPVLALANHFTHSQLKQRILMMMQSKSAQARQWKYAFFLPVCLAFLGISSALQAQKYQMGQYFTETGKPDVVVTSTDTVVTFNPATYEETVQIVQRESHTQVDVMPCFISDWGNCADKPAAERQACSQRAFGSAVMSQLKVPGGPATRGSVIVRVVVPKEGDMLRVDQVTQSLNPAYDAAALQALVRAKGSWLPAQKAGKAVDCVMYVPIVF